MFSTFRDLVAEVKGKMQCHQMILGLVVPDLEVGSPIDSFVDIVDKDPQQKESAVFMACVIVVSWEANSEYVGFRM